MHKVKYGLFFDNHTHPEITDTGNAFDVETFTDNLKSCGVDYIGFHARCNQGMAYYDTEIGIRHPSLNYDLFGKVVESCKRKNIAVIAYLNGGVSTMECIQHREWQTLYMKGTDLYGQNDPCALTMCYNSPFRDHIISMIREIISKYPVEGVFVDCILNFPCVCPTCVSMMKEQGIDWNDFDAVTDFSRRSGLSYCRDIAAAVREMLPDPMLYFNGPVFGDIADSDTFFDCECLPTSDWGYECLPVLAHFAGNIKPGTQLLNMTGRFYSWGDFGGLRTAESLKYDLLYGMAHGMRPHIGGHLHPRGDADQPVFDRIREVYTYLQQFDDHVIDAENLADIAIVVPEDSLSFRSSPSIKSAVRVLDELKMQFDIVFSEYPKRWDQYKLLILPEEIDISRSMEKRIREFISGGGAFFACGKNAAEKFGKEFGIKYLGDSGLNPVYFRMSGEFDHKIADMPLNLYASAAKAEFDGANGKSRLVTSYFQTGWNGSYALWYTPPKEATEMPFITVKEKCIWCAGDLFLGYSKLGDFHLRQIISNIISELVENPMIKVEDLPSFARVILSTKENKMNVHTIAYIPEKRGEAIVVEDPIAVINGTLNVLTAGRKVVSALTIPEKQPVKFEQDGLYTTLYLPLFKGYQLVSLSFES